MNDDHDLPFFYGDEVSEILAQGDPFDVLAEAEEEIGFPIALLPFSVLDHE